MLPRELMGAVQTIISCYRAAARSNTVLMSSSPTDWERTNFEAIVKGARYEYQGLLQIAARAATMNSRLRPASGARSTIPQSPSSVATESQTAAGTEASKRAMQYTNDQKRPNIHTALHYGAVMAEYGMPSNCNVLIGEDKHRYFKKIVYTTNHSQVERAMLGQENLQQTVRLLLLKAYIQKEPQLTALMTDLHDRCPSWFQALLPRSEQEGMLEDEEDELQIVASENHRRPAAIGCLRPKYCREILKLPTRSSNTALPPLFVSMLRRAYEVDYQMPNIMQFGTAGIKWCKKFSFFDRETERRSTFAMGSFIECTNGQIARIDQIFVHEILQKKRLFCKATLVERGGMQVDPILGLRMFAFASPEQASTIIGLPSVTARRLYILPVASNDIDRD